MLQMKGLNQVLAGGVSPAAMLALGVEAADTALGGGLELGRLHELAPLSPLHIGAAAGFALALATLARKDRRLIWVQQDFAGLETGKLYGLGCELFGFSAAKLFVVRAPRVRDALWAMEEALRTRAVSAVVGELCEEGKGADLTATRRLALAASQGGGLALLLRHRSTHVPNAAATRWEVTAARGANDGLGGLGRTGFALSLTKNRRGACGRWIVQWDHHEHRFQALSRGVDAPPLHRSGDARLRQAV